MRIHTEDFLSLPNYQADRLIESDAAPSCSLLKLHPIPAGVPPACSVFLVTVLSPHPQCPSHPGRYDSEGRLTNVTYPTGMVTSLHREIERSINIDIESSSRDDDVTVITNLSSVEASYTVVQGSASTGTYRK